MFRENDIDTLLNGLLGTDATVGATTIRVIFDSAYVPVQSFDGSIGTIGPRCQLKSSDVVAQAITHGSTMTIDGTTYTVSGPPQPDGTGMSTLIFTE